MMRTISALILAAFIGTAGALTATADMNAPAQATISTAALHSTPMTAAQVESAKALTAGKASAAPKKAAITTARIKQIRAWGGIAPCKHEDGSAQVLPCYWNAKVRGDGNGRSFIAMPSKGDDPRFVYLTR